MKSITVLEAIKQLSSVCDNASSKDDVGFAASDINLNHFASFPELTSGQQLEFKYRLYKYKAQLGVDEIICIDNKNSNEIISKNQSIAVIKTVKNKKITIASDYLYIIEFDYNSDLVQSVKKIPGIKYNHETKKWIGNISTTQNKSQLIHFLQENYFDFNLEMINNVEVITAKPSNRIEIQNQTISIYFEYDKPLIDAVKEIPGRKFDSDNKCWDVPLKSNNILKLETFLKNNTQFKINTELKLLINKYKKLNVTKLIQQKENAVLSNMAEASKNFNVRNGLNGILRPFQVAGVEYIVKNRVAFNGDEMGLGKTIQAIASIHHLQSYPALIVCPNSLKYNWKKEFNIWIPNLTIHIVESKDDELPDADIYISNYNSLKKQQENLIGLGLKAIVSDESHYIKNYKAQRTLALQEIVDNSDLELLLLLSGTIILNRPKELISQLQLLGKLDEFGGIWDFAKRYCNAKNTGYGFNMNGSSNLKELHFKLREICYIRRNKEDVLTELPGIEYQSIEVDITNRAKYNRAEKSLIKFLKEESVVIPDFIESINNLSEIEQKAQLTIYRAKISNNAKHAEHLVRINTLKQLVATGKIKASIEFIDNIIENEKLVVFTTHKAIANEISNHYNCLKIDGSVKAKDRQIAVDDFQENSDTKLIVINLAAGREGLTLTAASKLVFLEQGWTPGEHDQAAARIHRIGQHNFANIYTILGKDTIDENIYQLINKKRTVTTMINSGKEGKMAKQGSVMTDLIIGLTK